MSAAFGALLMWVANMRPPRPVYEYHDVKVLEQLGPRDWRIQRGDGETVWRCCPDYPCGTVIWPGYVMSKFRYEDFGGCNSILRADLGVWWQRAPNGDVIRIK